MDPDEAGLRGRTVAHARSAGDAALNETARPGGAETSRKAKFQDKISSGLRSRQASRGRGGAAWSAYTTGVPEHIARQLGGAHKSGDGWMCLCLCHHDKKSSLHISLGDTGKLLWHCHAGCDQAAVGDA